MFPRSDRQRLVVMYWCLISGIIHVIWEGSWSVVAPWLQSPSALHDARLYWTFYGLADHRYLHADPFVRSLELVTGTLVAALNFAAFANTLRRRRTLLPVIILAAASVMEVYGTILYFGSELFNGFANVDTHSFVRAWVMFFGLNALWLAFPGWCLYEIVASLRSPRTAKAPFAGAFAH